MSYNGFEFVVDSCPLSQEKTTEAATRLNCSEDEYGRSRYVCVPNQNLTALIEFCYTKTIVGIYQKGNCLRSIGNGFLDQISCGGFTEGCPDQYFRSTDLYKYPACLHLNTEEGCFIAESWCNASELVETSTDILGTLNMTTDFTSGSFNTTRTAVNDEPSIHAIGFSVTALTLVIITIIFFWRIWRSQASRMQRQVSLPDNMESLHLFEDHSSTLTDDEVSLLFCFLCSDSGPPDFNEKEWLDMLNEIRQDKYYKKNLVTHEKAQQSLDRLKSRDCLWTDQTREHLTEDAQDEIMYRVSDHKSSCHIYGRKGHILLFLLSSFIIAQKYLRSGHYRKKSWEKCFISDESFADPLLIRRLQLNILTHVIMEDTEICNKVSEILNVPMRIVKGNEKERKNFQVKLKQTGERIQCRKASHNSVDHVTWLWRYWYGARSDIVRSCIGLHPHNDIYIIDNKAYRKSSKYHSYQPSIRCLLYCVLLVEDYSLDVTDQTHRTLIEKLKEMYFTDVHLRDIINFTDIQGGIIDKQGSILKFKSDDIRHDVMYAFVTECLVEDSDLEFFLTTASRDVISEYCRSWWYERREGERCLYVPDEPGKMYDLFIDKLQLDIITHCTMSDKRITDRISKRLNIPEEVLGRNFDARQRFVKNSKLGSKEMFRARGMIVGCAGAGKTTLLRKLHGRIETDWNKPSKTTIGLEVHEDLFTIEDNKLIDFGMDKTDSDEKPYLDKKVISMTDFAGQVAYYACHQVYLSRRAFYIVVVDMSKKLKKESRMYDRDRHDPTGSLFHSWTYGDYVHFWLQTINTYCNDGITKKDPKDTREIKDSGVNVNFQPVILVATHKDKLVGLCKTSDTMDAFFSEVEECLSKEQTLKQLISPYRYFEVECPSKVLTRDQQRSIDLVKKCIVETVQQLPQWGEKIPLKWFEIERILNQKKSNGDRVLKRHQLMETAKTFLMDENDLNDVLRYLHEIGKIIYFSEDKLKETIIIDVQWFVDAFKYIITDKKHFARKDSKNIFVNTGKISKKYIEEVWKSIKGIYNSLWQSYVNNKDDIFQYMNKLGLMTKLETKGGVDNDEKMYYIPSMNRTDLPDGRKDEIYRKQKSSMMVYFFKSYLPHFFFFRLVVNCLRKWKVCNEESFFKNAAFYKAEEAGHFFAIAVSKTSIQLQVFTQDESVKEECVKKIRQTVESLIKEITETFHRGIIYDSGFSCKDINITDEDEEYFLKESEIIQEIRNSQEMPPCPRHLFEPNDHKVDANKIHMCLLERGSSMSIRDN